MKKQGLSKLFNIFNISKLSTILLLTIFLLPLVSAYGVTFYNPAWNPSDGKLFETIDAGKTYITQLEAEGLAVTSVSFSANKDAKTAGVSVHNMKSTPDFYPEVTNNMTYQFIEVKPNGFATHEMTKLALEFQVEKSWLLNNTIPQTGMVLYFWNSRMDVWEELPTKIESEDDNIVVYSAMTTDPSKYYLIAKSESAPLEEVKETVTDESGDNDVEQIDFSKDDKPITTSLPSTDTIGNPEELVETEEKESSLKYLFYVGLFALIAFIVYFVATSPKNNTGVDKEISRYIKESKRHGKSKDEIKKRLLKVGWHPNRVKTAMDKHKFSEEKPVEKATTKLDDKKLDDKKK